MLRKTKRALGVLGLLLVAVTAVGDERKAVVPGASVGGRVTAPTAAVVEHTQPQKTATNLTTQAVAEADDGGEYLALDALRRGIVRKGIEIESLEADQKIGDLKSSIGINTAQADLPELVGVYRMPRREWAEFLVGSAILSASVGDWVTAEWRLTRFLANGVELKGKAGEVRSVLFGRRDVPRPATH